MIRKPKHETGTINLYSLIYIALLKYYIRNPSPPGAVGGDVRAFLHAKTEEYRDGRVHKKQKNKLGFEPGTFCFDSDEHARIGS